MALATFTLTGNLARLLGDQVDVSRVNAWIESSAGAGEVIYDRDNDLVLIGDQEIDLDVDGSFSVGGLIGYDNVAADVTPVGLQYRVWLAYTEQRTRKLVTWNSGWLSITADGDISDTAPAQYLPPTYQNEFVDRAEAYLDEVEVIREQTRVLRDQAAGYLVLDLSTSDGQVALLVASPGSDTNAALNEWLGRMVSSSERPLAFSYTDGVLDSYTEYETDGTTPYRVVTYAYTGSQLDTATEVADGITAVTTYTYDGDGLLTGVTRSVTP